MPAQSGIARLQIGAETTRGTAVAATRVHRYNDLTWSRNQVLQTFEAQVSDSLALMSTNPKVRREGTGLVINEFLSFEQVLLPMLAGVRGGVTPTTPATATNTRLWTFTPTMDADPSPLTVTAEYIERQGTTRDAVEAAYMFVVGFSITVGIDATPTLQITLMGRKTTDTTYTASLSLPSLSFANDLNWGLFDDASWSAAGTTRVAATVRNLTASWGGFLIPRYFGDLRADADFSEYGYMDTRVLDVSGVVAVEPGSGGFTTIAKARKTAGTPRVYRLGIVGDNIESTFNRFVHLDFAGVHAEDSLQDLGSNEEGMNTRSLHLRSIRHTTGSDTHDVRFVVQNNLTAYP